MPGIIADFKNISTKFVCQGLFFRSFFLKKCSHKCFPTGNGIISPKFVKKGQLSFFGLVDKTIMCPHLLWEHPSCVLFIGSNPFSMLAHRHQLSYLDLLLTVSRPPLEVQKLSDRKLVSQLWHKHLNHT